MMERLSEDTENPKDLGVFETPKKIVNLMISLIDRRLFGKDDIRVLEPGCGTCPFLSSLLAEFRKHGARNVVLDGIDIRKVEGLKGYNKEYIKYFNIVYGDYLLWNPGVKYDLIIGNPPYGIPSLSDHYSIKVDDETKRVYKSVFETWFGKYNIYGAFIEKSVRLLKEGGQLIFVVPATFMILDDFKKLRKFLSDNGKTSIIYLGSNFFENNVDVSVVILKFIKSDKYKRLVSLYDVCDDNFIPKFVSSNWCGDVIAFHTEFVKFLEERGVLLEEGFDIKVSPRTTEIARNPIVSSKKLSNDYMNILNSRNLGPDFINYDLESGYWIRKSDKTSLKDFFSIPHLVVGIGKKRGKLACAYDYRAYPWMGDVYHLLLKKNLTPLFDYSYMVKYMNSEIVSRYIQEKFRDITYHFNATQIKSIPVVNEETFIYLGRNDYGM